MHEYSDTDKYTWTHPETASNLVSKFFYMTAQ